MKPTLAPHRLHSSIRRLDRPVDTRRTRPHRGIQAVLICGLASVMTAVAWAGPDTPAPPSNMLASAATFVSFDTETTGFDSKKGHILEIACVKFRKGQILDQKSWLINPGVPIPAQSQRVHGITAEMVSNCPPFAAVYPEFREFIGDAVLLAHNARFDIGFVATELSRLNEPRMPNTVLDTLPLFRRWFPDARRYNLAALSQFLRINVERPHRAAADALTVEAIFQLGLQKAPEGMTLEEVIRSTGGGVHFPPPPPSAPPAGAESKQKGSTGLDR